MTGRARPVVIFVEGGALWPKSRGMAAVCAGRSTDVCDGFRSTETKKGHVLSRRGKGRKRGGGEAPRGRGGTGWGWGARGPERCREGERGGGALRTTPA